MQDMYSQMMLTLRTEEMAISKCRRLCETFRLDQVYLARKEGSHLCYLTGYGHSSPDQPGQLWLSDKIVLFWHGFLPPEIQDVCKRYFHSLLEHVRQEMSVMDELMLDESNKQEKET